MQYSDIIVLQHDTEYYIAELAEMAIEERAMNSIALRLPDELIKEVDKVSRELERSKSYVIRKAIQNYIKEYFDYQVALDRLNDKDDEIISSKKMRALIEKER